MLKLKQVEMPLDIVYNSLDSAISDLQKLQHTLKKMGIDTSHTSLHIDTIYHPYDHDGTPTLQLWYSRPYTQEELDAETKLEESLKQNRKAQFEQLKKEFGE